LWGMIWVGGGGVNGEKKKKRGADVPGKKGWTIKKGKVTERGEKNVSETYGGKNGGRILTGRKGGSSGKRREGKARSS